MLKIGDKVKFLNAMGGGKVTGFVSPKVVTIEDDQGFEVPVLITELIKDVRFDPTEPAYMRAIPRAEKKEEPKPKKEALPLFASSAGKPATDTPSYYLAFVPEVPTMPLSGQIRVWLVNDTPNTILYHFSLLKEEMFVSEKSGRLAPYSRVPLKGFTHNDLSDFPGFGMQILPFSIRSRSLQTALQKTIRVNPIKFYKESVYTGNAYFETRAWIIALKEKDLTPELEKLKNHDFNAPQILEESGDVKKPEPKRKETPELKEVDLHIHELIDQAEGIEPKELLGIQMDRFRFEMETAIQNGTKRIVFIHGVGQGTLKNELRRELSNRYKKYDFQDASFREYGYGATMVILRK